MKEIFLPLGVVDVEWVGSNVCCQIRNGSDFLHIITVLQPFSRRFLERDPVAKALHASIQELLFERSTSDLMWQWGKVKEIIVLQREDGDLLVIGEQAEAA